MLSFEFIWRSLPMSLYVFFIFRFLLCKVWEEDYYLTIVKRMENLTSTKSILLWFIHCISGPTFSFCVEQSNLINQSFNFNFSGQHFGNDLTWIFILKCVCTNFNQIRSYPMTFARLSQHWSIYVPLTKYFEKSFHFNNYNKPSFYISFSEKTGF